MSLLLDQGLALHRQGRLEKAEEKYLLALNENFDDWQALLFLGTLYLQRNVIPLAAECLMRSIDVNKESFESWNNLGNCFKTVNREPDAKACWDKCLSIVGKGNEDYADVYNNISTLFINSGTPKEAEEYAKKALELCPGHYDANWNLGLAWLEQGMFKEGFSQYHWGFKTKNRMMRDLGDQVKYWNGERNKIVSVWGEQGIGDEILFSSMIPELQKISKEVIFECHPRLIKIFRESFPGVILYGTRKDQVIGWNKDHKNIEYKTIIGDLARHFRSDIKDFPTKPSYLKATPDRIEFYQQKLSKLGNRKKIGISWTGGYTKTRKDYRSIPLEQWEPILRNDCDFISLQYTPEAYATVADIEDRYDLKIHHWPSAVHNDDYNETAALVSALDLVITVNTSAHHLAGALGKKCWTLTPVGKAWRYWSPDGHSNPWYPSVHQYQQEEQGNWKPVIEQVANDLKEFAK